MIKNTKLVKNSQQGGTVQTHARVVLSCLFIYTQSTECEEIIAALCFIGKRAARRLQAELVFAASPLTANIYVANMTTHSR